MVRRRAQIPIVLMIAAVCAASAVNLSAKPRYTATASVVARNILTILKPIKFEELATSTSVAAHVREQLRLSESAQDLARRIKATAGQSALYGVSVTDPVPDRAIRIANAVSLEAARRYTDLAAGTPATTADQVDGERASYRERYLAAAQRLLDYEALHPDVLVGSQGSETLPPDLQGRVLDQAGGTPSLQPLSPQLATTDLRAESQYLALQLGSRLAADAYHNFEAETAKTWVAAMNNAHDYGAQVVDPAVVAEPDTAARRWRIVYAGILALIIGTGISFAREFSQRRMRASPAGSGRSGESSTAATASTAPR
jgi:capsular polysaccharide biosynthesis protein